MSRKIVAGNWKMNKNREDAFALLDALNERRNEFPIDVKVIIAPPAIYLSEFAQKNSDEVNISAQDCSRFQSGAFTGETSAEMIKSSGIHYCIVGHSERRDYHKETSEIVGEKVESCLKNNVRPIFCCGEHLEDRESENHFEVVSKQIQVGLFSLSSDEISKVIVAYEPVWAIGTGKTASSDQAQEMHAFIRNLLKEKFGDAIAQAIPILYGGSCKPSNAQELFSKEDVDGGLIGGASLNADDFIGVIRGHIL